MLAHIICTLLLANQEGAEARMGMTDRQIIAMGHQDFVNKFSDKFGSSTAAMCQAEVTYGEVIKKTNDKALKAKPTAQRTAVASLRKQMAMFRNEMCDVGRAFSGGGTMWNIAYAGTEADVEETVALLIGVRPNRSKALNVSDGTKAIDNLAAAAKENMADIESYKDSGSGMAEVNSSLAIARKAYGEIVRVAAKRPRRESDAIIAFVIDGVRLATD